MSHDAQCTECDEEGCPGITRCPRCGAEEHGADALTHVQDHGCCRQCLVDWQFDMDREEEP